MSPYLPSIRTGISLVYVNPAEFYVGRIEAARYSSCLKVRWVAYSVNDMSDNNDTAKLARNSEPPEIVLRPGRAEIASVVVLQAVLIAVLGAGSTNGFGVFAAPRDELYPPLIVGGAIDLATFAALSYWILPTFGRRRGLAQLCLRLSLALAVNVILQVAAQQTLIAITERSPKGVTILDLTIENTYGAVTTIMFSILYRAVFDWAAHRTREWRMADRISNLETTVSGLREDIARVAQKARGGDVIELGAGKALLRVVADEIFFLKAAGNYTEVHTRTQVHTIYGTLKALMAQLPQPLFARTHRSYIVNLSHARAIRHGAVILDVAELPVGTLQRASLQVAWEQWRALSTVPRSPLSSGI